MELRLLKLIVMITTIKCLLQSADTLLTMTGIIASFVVAKRGENLIGISSRSLGEVNVQLIMENLGGGGHLTNAATQMKNVTVDEAEEKLRFVIDDYLQGGTQS